MDLDTDIDVETCHISDNGRPHRYPGLQNFFFFSGKREKKNCQYYSGYDRCNVAFLGIRKQFT